MDLSVYNLKKWNCAVTCQQNILQRRLSKVVLHQVREIIRTFALIQSRIQKLGESDLTLNLESSMNHLIWQNGNVRGCSHNMPDLLFNVSIWQTLLSSLKLTIWKQTRHCHEDNYLNSICSLSHQVELMSQQICHWLQLGELFRGHLGSLPGLSFNIKGVFLQNSN